MDQILIVPDKQTILSTDGRTVQTFDSESQRPLTAANKKRHVPLLSISEKITMNLEESLKRYTRPKTTTHKTRRSEASIVSIIHTENKGLRPDGKFTKFIDDVREARVNSELTVRNTIQNVKAMNTKDAKEIKVKLAERKHYLEPTRKIDLTKIEFTKNSDILNEERKLLSMKRALDQVRYEKENRQKVVKYTTGATVPQSDLAQPKYPAHEEKVSTGPRLKASASEHQITIERAEDGFLNMNLPLPLSINSAQKCERIFEINRNRLQKFCAKLPYHLDVAPKTAKPKMITERQMSLDMQTPLWKSSTDKPSKILKRISKKNRIEKRVDSPPGVESYLQPLTTEPDSSFMRTVSRIPSVPSPVFALSIPVTATKSSHWRPPKQLDQKSDYDSPAFFLTSQTPLNAQTPQNYHPVSPINIEPDEDVETIDLQEDVNADLTTKRYEKARKVLQTSARGKHIRTPNEKWKLKETYKIPVDSLVSPANAKEIAQQVKTSYFKGKVVDDWRKLTQSPESFSSNLASKAKVEIYNGYRSIYKACEKNRRSTPSLNLGLLKSIESLNEGMEKMNKRFAQKEMDIDIQIKEDIITDMQKYSLLDIRSMLKPKRPTTSVGREK